VPNIHPVTLEIDGNKKKLNLCTRCLRTYNKADRKAAAAAE
jgi:ribosomal protein L28